MITFAEAIAEIASALGRDVRYTQITPEEFAAGLQEAGVPEDYRWLLDYIFNTVLDGRNEYTTDDVKRALGREPRDFSDFVRTAVSSGLWSSSVHRVA